MIILQFKSKKYKAEIYENKIKQILQDYKKSAHIQDEDNPNIGLHMKTYESFDYCLAQVKRKINNRFQYKSTPN